MNQCEWYSERSREIALATFREARVGNVLPYRLSFVCRFIKRNMPKIMRVIEALEAQGFRAARAWGYHDAIVTNASLDQLIDVIKSL